MSFSARVYNYDLKKTLESGQMFRYKEVQSGVYRVISRDKVCYAKQVEDTIMVRTGEEKQTSVTDADIYWRTYFGFGQNYERLIELVKGNKFLEKVVGYNLGLRILKQDPWECLISFIISQKNNIPHIMQCIEKLCAAAGSAMEEGLFAFPTPKELCSLSIDKVGLGYRKAYVLNAAYQVDMGYFQLDKIGGINRNYKAIVQELCTLNGVGPKVANCVALFGYGCLEAFPIDVHIARILGLPEMSDFKSKDYGDLAGVLQQYLFNYAINNGL